MQFGARVNTKPSVVKNRLRDCHRMVDGGVKRGLKVPGRTVKTDSRYQALPAQLNSLPIDIYVIMRQ